MTKTTRLPITALFAVALAAAGCGGTSKPPSAGNSGSGKPDQGIQAAYKFSRCMRQHGVSGFPDPVVHSSPGQTSVGIHITPALSGSPSFKTAQTACQGIMPGPGSGNGGPSPQQLAAHVRGLVSFAGCMRTHQVPTFPDPTTQGQINPAMIAAAGINLKAPAVRAAALACVPASQGQLTKAQIVQALGPG